MTSRVLACALLLCGVGLACAQTEPPDLQQYIAKQFGEGFKLAPLLPRGVGGRIAKDAKPMVLLTGDVDADGTEDVIILAHAPANPLLGQEQFHYRVADPYDQYFGFGDPKVTRQLAAVDPDRERALLIVHDWRAATPKAKFVIINLPFDNLKLDKVAVKKKMRMALVSQEGGIIDSLVYWDGKRYKYEPGTAEGVE